MLSLGKFNDSIRALLKPDQYANFLKATPLERYAQVGDALGKDSQGVLDYICEHAALPVLETFEILDKTSIRIPTKLIYEYQCLPVKGEGNFLHLVCAWPLGPKEFTWLSSLCSEPIKVYLALPELINGRIKAHFGVGSASLEGSGISADEDLDEASDDAEDQNAAVIRFVNDIIQGAVVDRATDIHFEPLKESLQIRYRVDGQLVPVSLPPNLVKFKGAIISRLKIMARLNISERRRPQDGRINYSVGKTELDIRISTFPTLYGESISLRLLSDKNLPSTLDELGFLPEDQTIIKKTLERPYGMILVTGPTGSGKSTSLSAFIRIINSPQRRIITVEDPVEYEITGVNQSQVNPEIELTFASSLRHILRQDPDVIMVGEIRDKETAEIGIRASQTGHLVLSTLHTNDAPGALTRLIDMDIEPFLIASSVELVIAQRLVRRLCHACSIPTQITAPQVKQCLSALHVTCSEEDLLGAIPNIREPKGCKACNGLGYKGRVGIFEILRNTEDIHEQVIQRSSTRAIRQKAMENGMRSMQSCGWQIVKKGVTSLAEIMRFAEVGGEE